ncbi:MAG: hypothetical protein SFT94_09890 [Pseudanabaenaceae cyanobacterium bins.68]|nr:hypothetical protein [Pseudanabaenaceae cyanobacterium bins.68]
MFLLTLQDVEVINFGKPSATLSYRNNRYRLAKFFGDQKQAALAFARGLIDQPQALCVVLEETEKYSVWSIDPSSSGAVSLEQAIIQGGLLLMQQVNRQLDQYLNAKRLGNWQQELQKALQKGRLPQTGSPEAIAQLLQINSQTDSLPTWDDSHVQTLLAELHRLLCNYLGKAKAEVVIDQALSGLGSLSSSAAEQFQQWLSTTPKGKLWQHNNEGK